MTERPVGWRKSSRSAQQTNCVEVARIPGGTVVRDSKNPVAQHIIASRAQWRSFLAAIELGRFDRPRW